MSMPEKITTAEKKHSLTLKNREGVTVDGVLEVVSFDEGQVVLKTCLGTLTVEGEGLHVQKLLLDCGEVSLCGKIVGLFYSERGDGERGGLFRKGWR